MKNPTIEESLTALLVILIGFYVYVLIAWRSKSNQWTLSSFFLGGKKIGVRPTKHTNWGIGFAFANGIWFCATLAYKFGWTVLVIQLIWSCSIAALGFFLRPYLTASRDETIHGYLGVVYGSGARIIACLATTIGYVMTCGFEVYYSSEILSRSIGQLELAVPFSIVLAILFGSYCMIGGYEANVRTDRPQNILGALTMSVLVLVLFACLWPKIGSAPDQRTWATLFRATIPPWDMLLGLGVFLSVFNLVDMANWQSISANSELPDSQKKVIPWAYYKSAAYQMVFPSLAGGLVGCGLRVFDGLQDGDLFPTVFGSLLPGLEPLTRGVFLGAILLGCISLTLSSADSFLMAAANTLSWDLFKHHEYREIALTTTVNRAESEKEYVLSVRRWLIPLAIAMVLIFWRVYIFVPDKVFQLQFIMYGSALSLAPGLFYALRNGLSQNVPFHSVHWWVVASIACGVMAGLAPLALLIARIPVFGQEDWTSLSPVLTLSLSYAVFLIGRCISGARSPNLNEAVS